MRKRLAILLLFECLIFSVHAQDYTDLHIHSEVTNCIRPDCICEAVNGNLLVGVSECSYENADVKKATLLEYGRDGRLLNSIGLPFTSKDEPTTDKLLVRDPNEDDDVAYLYGFVYRDADSVNAFVLFKLDEYLAVVERIDVPLFSEEWLFVHYLFDPYGDIVLQWTDEARCNHFAKITLDGVVAARSDFGPFEDDYHFMLENYTHFSSDVAGKPGQLQVFGTSPLRYCLARDFINIGVTDEAHSEILVFDSLLNNIERVPFAKQLGYFVSYGSTCVKSCGDRLYMSIAGHKSPPIRKYAWLAEIDEDFNVLRKYRYNYPDHMTGFQSLLPFVQAADGGWYLVFYSNVVLRDPNYALNVTKLDAGLNLEWERWCPVEVDEWFFPWILCALEDGGLSLCGDLIYTYPGNAHTIVYTFTDEGLGVGEAADRVRPYCLLPNPVKDVLSVRVSPDVRLATLELYDAAGRCVARSRTAEMNVAALPAGHYVAKVVLQDGTAYSDKVIKE